jgi:uncharacterized protein YbjT (DUF2867 family)
MILVTGAAGLNGSAIIREFSRRGVQVRALVRDRIKVNHLARLPGVAIVEGNMCRPETLAAALDGVDRVLMISSAAPDMVETQRAFIDVCRQARVQHVVKFSGAESGIGFDQMKFRFTRMHREVELHLEGSGLAWTHLRPSQFMQVYLREAPMIVEKGAIFLPFGDIALSPIDVEDIAKIAVEVLCTDGHAGESYEMTGPEALTMEDVAAQISAAIGKTIRYVSIAPEARRRALLAAGLSVFMADALDEQTAERLKCPSAHIHLGTHERLGLRPTTFAQFAIRSAPIFLGEHRVA